MKYDPIMCMMVDDSVKTKDGLDDPEKNAGYEMKKEGQYFKIYKNGKLIAMKSTEEEARREASRHRAANDSDKKTIDKAIRACDSRVSTRNVVTSNIAFEEIKKMTGIIPEKVKQKGDTMEFYHSGVKVAEWDMNNAEVKVFV